MGASVVYASYFNKSIELSEAFPQGRSAKDYKQRLIGLDFEYGMGYFQFIGEWIFNQWQVPNLTEGHLSSSGGYVDGKCDLGLGLYYALRFGRIGYKEIDDGLGLQHALGLRDQADRNRFRLLPGSSHPAQSPGSVK